jgi:hypothetical protein
VALLQSRVTSATLPHGRGGSSTRRRQRSGTRSGGPAGPRRPSWPPTSDCGITSRTVFRVWSRRPNGRAVGPAGPNWKGRNKPHRGDRRRVEAWSPEQISQRLPVDFPDDESMRISHEAIYRALYVQGRGALKRELVACLRTGRALRVPRSRSRQKTWAHVTPEVMISERPGEADDRAVPGHWEGDLLIGLERSAIGTLVERTPASPCWYTFPERKASGSSREPRTGLHWPATGRSR